MEQDDRSERERRPREPDDDPALADRLEVCRRRSSRAGPRGVLLRSGVRSDSVDAAGPCGLRNRGGHERPAAFVLSADFAFPRRRG